jgi:hypothetical protein
MFTRLAVLGLVAGLAAACATDQRAGAPAGPVTLASAGEQPGALEPGLAVWYSFGDYGHVDDVTARAGGLRKPDATVPNLSFHGGEGDKVPGTNSRNLVGAVFSGYLRFPEASSYRIGATSNDGVRVIIAGRVILEDPKPHPHRAVGPTTVSVAEAGWYPIEVIWFERKGSFRLELNWSAEGGLAPIRPEFFGH